MVFDVTGQTLTMYRTAKIAYDQMSMEAAVIALNWKTNLVKATGVPDSAGRLDGLPVFKERQDTYNANEINYNFNTKKGVIQGIVTQQGEGFIKGKRVKKISDDEMFVGKADYTTCNLKHPHFAIKSSKMKTRLGKYVISGPFHLEFNQVPLPIFLPFGLFPIPKERASGIIVPTYGEAPDRGFYLRQGGFYWAASDYMGFKFLGNIYTRGGWGLSVLSDYRKRYAFNGNFSFEYNKVIREVESPQTRQLVNTETSDFWFRWSHTPQPKGSTRFSANVNLGTNTFNRNNSFVTNDFLAGSFNSNVSFSTSFRGTPFSLSSNLRHQQNIRTGLTTVSPDMNIAMQRIFPFRGKSGRTKGLIRGINFSYTGNVQGEIRNDITPVQGSLPGARLITSDTARTTRIIDFYNGDSWNTMLERMRWGVRHNIPLSTNITVLRHLQLTPNINYSEVWSPYSLNYTFVREQNGIRIDTLNQMARGYAFSTGIGTTTRFYGIYFFKEGYKVSAIRHMMTPTVALAYTPDLSRDEFGMYQTVQADTSGRMLRLSRTQGALFGVPAGTGAAGNVSFGLDNQLEMKVRQRTDTSETYKKVPLLQNLNFTGTYNLLADSFRLSNINVNARTQLFEKIGINLSGVIDPYTYVPVSRNSENGAVLTQRRIDTYAWQAGNGIGKLSNISLALNTSFKPKTKKKPDVSDRNRGFTPGDRRVAAEEALLRDIRDNPQRYVDFNVPWTLNLNYNLAYNQVGFLPSTITQTVNASGDLSITPKTKIAVTTGYDMQRREMAFTSLNIFRDLHCWQMSVNWIPFGIRQSFNVDISVKASLLQDLKISRRNSWFDR